MSVGKSEGRLPDKSLSRVQREQAWRRSGTGSEGRGGGDTRKSTLGRVQTANGEQAESSGASNQNKRSKGETWEREIRWRKQNIAATRCSWADEQPNTNGGQARSTQVGSDGCWPDEATIQSTDDADHRGNQARTPAQRVRYCLRTRCGQSGVVEVQHQKNILQYQQVDLQNQKVEDKACEDPKRRGKGWANGSEKY